MKTTRLLGSAVGAIAIVALGVTAEKYWQAARTRAEGERLASEGRQALGALQFTRASALFDAALRKPSDDQAKSERHAQRATARHWLGDLAGATADLTEAIELTSDRGALYADRARANQAQGEAQKAIEDYNAAIAHGSTEADNYLARGSLLLEAGQAETAASDFGEVIARAPEDLGAILRQARAFAASNQPEKAIASYDAVLALDPINQEALAARGDLYSRNGEVAKAMADFGELRTGVGEAFAQQSARQFAAKSGSQATEFLRDAEIKASGGHPDEAISLYNRVLQMEVPLSVASNALQNRGNVYHAQGDDERAMRDYDQALRFNPANAGGYLNRGVLFAHKGDSRSALMDYNEALRINPKMSEAFYNRALTYAEEGDAEAAMRDLDAALELNPKFAYAHITRGNIFLSEDRLDEATADVEAALATDLESPPAHLLRGDILVRQHAYTRALRDFEKVSQSKGKIVPTALNSMAWIQATCPEKSARDGTKAIANALRACELTGWEMGQFVDTLASAYAEHEDFEKAVDFQLYALTLPGFTPEDEAVAGQRVVLYRAHHPYRETPAAARGPSPNESH